MRKNREIDKEIEEESKRERWVEKWTVSRFCRARQSLWIVGDPDALRASTDWNALIEHARNTNSYEREARKEPSRGNYGHDRNGSSRGRDSNRERGIGRDRNESRGGSHANSRH
jgi:hypothetical protein